MVNSCVAANCTNKSSLSLGISLHTIPFFNDDRPEANVTNTRQTHNTRFGQNCLFYYLFGLL